MGRIVRNIKVGPSPDWVAKFLESIGQRSINNIVDATNIVMFDCGQPIHAFDLRQISNSKIVVKNAKDGEKLELVGSEKITAELKDTDMVITDEEQNLAIAGVRGGFNSGVSDDTTDILIEVANFDPASVRQTARRLGILTDASKRYENDIPLELSNLAMEEISALILEMCPEVEFESIMDEGEKKNPERKISFSTEYISKMLGENIKEKNIENILKNYQYEFSQTPGVWQVEVPYWRLDISGPHDMAEEIGRIYGYDKITPQLPKDGPWGGSLKDRPLDNPEWIKICSAKQKLIKDGYREIMTYGLIDKGEIELSASASDKNFLRTNLSDGLKESIKLNKLNLPLLDINELKIFEIGTVFLKSGEKMHVAWGDEKNIIEITLEDFNLGVELPNEANSKQLVSADGQTVKIFKPWSIYPFITRDIAVWVDENVKSDELKKIYQELGTELLVREPKLFDQFTKNNKTSHAFRLVFQSYDKTLTDNEINQIMDKITSKIISLGWEVR